MTVLEINWYRKDIFCFLQDHQFHLYLLSVESDKNLAGGEEGRCAGKSIYNSGEEIEGTLNSAGQT